MAAALLACAMFGCGSASCRYPESILFSDILTDNVYLACPDGSAVRTLLAKTSTRGFEVAVGVSLQVPIFVVGLDETATPPSSTERLELYDTVADKFTEFPGLPGEPGWPSAAPDGHHVAFEYFPHPGPGAAAGLWAGDAETGDANELVSLPPGVQINAPSWSPDGGEILCLEIDFRRFPDVTTSLVEIDYPSGQARTLFGPSAFVGAAAFSPDGRRFAVWTGRGIEMVDAETLQAKMVLPIASLGGRLLNRSGLIWGGRDNLIALALRVPNGQQSQLWVVRPDGTGLREVYTASDAGLVVGSFVTGAWSAARSYPGP